MFSNGHAGEFFSNPRIRKPFTFCNQDHNSSWKFCIIFGLIFGTPLMILFIASLASSGHKKNHGPALEIFPCLKLDSKNMPIDDKMHNRKNYLYWTEIIDTYLEEYVHPNIILKRGKNLMNCSYEHPRQKGEVCDVNIKNLNPCASDMYYGYDTNAPCIFLKLIKTNGWVPECYNSTKYLPPHMPKELKSFIENKNKNEPNQMNTVWISCEGVNHEDIENLIEINYKNMRGFPSYFFSSEIHEGYLNPLVVLQPQVHFQPGKSINVKCTAWAHNLSEDPVYFNMNMAA